MVTLLSISLNHKVAYFHIDIHPAYRRFLKFVASQQHYQYRVLPFGFSTAPGVFTKVLSVVAAHFPWLGDTVYPYLDD